MADDVVKPRSGSSDHRWQGQETGAASGGGARRQFWFIVLAGLFLSFASLIVVWILLIKPPLPPPYFLTINIADYNPKQYPVVAFALQDGERIRRHFPGGVRAQTNSTELLRGERGELASLASRTESTVVVHITALALAREEKVYLLPADAEPNDESTWVEVRDVVNAIAKCPAKDKLLILDLAHPLADPYLGVLSDRVAETLDEYFTNEKPPFLVLCPCSPGQYSLTSEVFGSSVFSYYLDQGLEGHADLDKDSRVTVKELFTFVEARVDRWAKDNRASRQKPRLFGKGDFVLASVSKGATPENPELDAYPSRLQDDWKDRDVWWDKEAFRRAPRILHKLETTLLRQEKRWRGGAISKKHMDSIDEDTKALLNDLKGAMLMDETPARSLALALAQAGKKENAELVESVLFLLAGAKDLGAKKENAAKVEEELVANLQKQKSADFPERASAVVEALTRIPQLSPNHVRLANGALAALKPKQRYIELLYVQRLVEYADRLEANKQDNARWQPEKTQAVLRTMRTHQAVIAALNRERQLLPWLAPFVNAGDKLRRSGEKKLLSSEPRTWNEAFQELQSANESYKHALQVYDTLQLCRLDLDRSFAQLPAYGRLFWDGPEIDAHAEATWKSAAEVAKELQAFFVNPPELDAAGEKSVPIVELGNHARNLHRHLQDLEEMLGRRIKRAKKDDNAESMQQLVSLLESPLLKAPERAVIFGKQRELAVSLQGLTDKKDQDDNRQARTLSLPDAEQTSQQKNRGLGRADMSLGLLRMAGIDVAQKRFDLPPMDAKVTAQNWANLERAMHSVWSKELVAQWHNTRSALSADAFNRVVSPWASDKRAGGIKKDASRVLQEDLRLAFLDWLEKRYQAEGTALQARAPEASAQDQQASAFYLDAARELRSLGAN